MTYFTSVGPKAGPILRRDNYATIGIRCYRNPKIGKLGGVLTKYQSGRRCSPRIGLGPVS
jgi:hypothetical protein